MGFKLQDRIQRTKGLPGKYKRLLLAMASHAYNDGTNVWAAKTTLAEEMGTDRRTVNRNMDGLLMTGLVREAEETHRCSNDFCPKGSKHYTERGNHWTQAYNIDLVAVQNVTPLPKKVVRHFVQESRDILSNSRVTKCPAKQGYGNPAPLGIKEEASVLTNGSELVSKPASEEMAGAQTFHTEDKTKPESLSSEEATLLNEIIPVRVSAFDHEHKSDLSIILAWADKLGVDAFEVLRYNRSVKKGGLYIRTPRGFANALMGDAEGNFALLNEYVVWRDKGRPKTKSAHASGTRFSDLCAECGWDKKDGCTCKVTAAEIEAMEGDDNPVAVGKGFDVEAAE